MTNPAAAFVELVRRAAAGLPRLRWLWCARCQMIRAHRLAARTSLGEDIFKCENCGMSVAA